MVARNTTTLERHSECESLTDVGSGVDLPREALSLAAWRKLTPLPRPDAAPFDLTESLRRLGRVRMIDYATANWDDIGIPATMSPEEADFWLLAMVKWCEGRPIPEIVASLRSMRFTGHIAYEKAVPLFRQPRRTPPPEMAAVLAALLGPDLFLDALLSGEFRQSETAYYLRNQTELSLLQGAWLYVRPYLTDAETASLRDAVRPLLRPETWPKQHNDALPVAYYLAAIFGMHDEVWRLVRSWQFTPNDPVRQLLVHSLSPLLILMGLRDPAVFESKVRELGVPLLKRFDLRAWFAMTGVNAVDYAAAQIARHRGGHAQLIVEFARIQDPAAARHMLAFRTRGKNPTQAREWLDQNIGSAVAGLLPLALGRDKVSLAAIDYLRDVVTNGHADVIERELAHVEPAVVAKVRRAVLDRPVRISVEMTPDAEPDWLRKQLAGWPTRIVLPTWLNLATLPPILVNGNRLTVRHVAVLIAELKQVSPKQSDPFGMVAPFAESLKANADAASLDAFATDLFERWLAEKTPGADGWVLIAAGRLGGDATVAAISPRIRRWPGGTSARRVRDAISALRRVGTDYARSQLVQLATHLPNRRHREFAQEQATAMATARGLTAEQLEDRSVPDLGLSNGGIDLDFGPRRFRLAIGANLSAVAVDPRGKAHSTLPTPRKSDDPVRVAECRETFTRLKGQLAEVIAALRDRFERGLIHRRRWSLDDFVAHLVRHPVAGAVTRRLVWGWYAENGTLHGTFRITDDGGFADSSDRIATPLAPNVGLVHPVQLSEPERIAWREQFADYELVPPFPQLGRRVFDLPDANRDTRLVTLFQAKGITSSSAVTVLRSGGWASAGEYHRRHFPTAGVTAVMHLIGWDRRELRGCLFAPTLDPAVAFAPETALPLGDVCPVVRCEVFADLEALTAAGAPPA